MRSINDDSGSKTGAHHAPHQPDAWPLVEVRIPDNLRTEVEDRLSEDTAATWDSIVRDIAEQKFEDDDAGDDE